MLAELRYEGEPVGHRIPVRLKVTEDLEIANATELVWYGADVGPRRVHPEYLSLALLRDDGTELLEIAGSDLRVSTRTIRRDDRMQFSAGAILITIPVESHA